MYYHKKETTLNFQEAVEKIKSELQKQGFGILTEIDVQTTLKKKLNVDYDKYVILGACNPPSAYKALQLEKNIGVYLPCNVIVYEDAGKVFISCVLPKVAMSRIGNDKLKVIAEEVETKLKTAVDNC